ncbi:MAG TPA: alpha/beta hydrolase [Clostridia bacterium]|nr:alpha/beta hydrolase [Clostridia bacterium]
MKISWDSIKAKYKRVKNSVIIINKLHVVMIFLILGVADFGLAVYGFLTYMVIYIYNIFTTRLPIESEGVYESITRVYKKEEDHELKMDIWYPNNKRKNHPLVLFAHGGGWVSGFRNQPNNISWCKYLASNGFAVASIDYRFGLKNTMQDILMDYTDALAFLKEQGDSLDLSSDNIVLMGLSAGGHLSMLYASYYSHNNDVDAMKGIRGVVAYYSPSDLTDILSPESKSLFARLATIRTLKGRPDQKAQDYEDYSPIKWISDKMPPVLVVHGKADQTVPFASSEKLVERLKECNVPFRFLVHPNGKHCFEMNSKDFQTIRILKKTIDWMKGMFTNK